MTVVSLGEVDEGVLQTQDSPDEQLIRLEQRELIRRTMETLPQKDRDIARAFYLDGASYNELTSTHGLSDKAISFRLSRAKQQLSKRLRYLLDWCVRFSRTDAEKTLYERSNRHESWNYPQNDGWSDRVDCADYHRFRWDTPDECAYSRGAGVSVAVGGLERYAHETIPKDSQLTLLKIQKAGTICHKLLLTSIAGTDRIDDFFDQPDETDMAQFAIETEI